MFSWIGTGIFFLLTGSAFMVAILHPGWVADAAIYCCALATVLVFPPLWRQNRNRVWRSVRIGLATVLAVVALLIPVKTHAVLDVPSHISTP